MNDEKLIWEAYTNSDTELLDESVWSTIVDLYKDLMQALKRGIRKEDIVYWLSLVKSRNINFYNTLFKKIRLYVKHGIGKEKYDNVTTTILVILMNLVAFPTAVITVTKIVPIDKMVDFAWEHKGEVMQFIDEVEVAVDKLSTSLHKEK